MAFPIMAVIGAALKAKGGADADRADAEAMYRQGLSANANNLTQTMLQTRQLRQRELENEQGNLRDERSAGMAGMGMLAQIRQDAMRQKYIGSMRSNLLKAMNSGGM